MTKRKSLSANGSSLHESVREEIRSRIGANLYKKGEAIPSTSQLGEEFGVSPITIKRALRDLQSAGLLASVPGKGTFVKEQRRFVRELDVWMTSMDNAYRLGFEPSIQLVSISKAKITEPALSVFNPPSEPLLCVRKIVSADDTRIMYDTAYISANLPQKIIDEFGKFFIADALRRHQIKPTDLKVVIDAAPASFEAQQAFTIPNGYPMLRRLYQIRTIKPGITVYGIVESPFDRLACSISLPAPTDDN